MKNLRKKLKRYLREYGGLMDKTSIFRNQMKNDEDIAVEGFLIIPTSLDI